MTDLLGGRKVQRQAPIREQVADILREAIVEMRLGPGQLLVEGQLCEMTSASRPSVREALRQLEAEGLVESHNGRGTVVAVATPELARHVYQLRAELGGLAAELFVANASDQQRAELSAAVAEVERAVREDGSTTAILAAKNQVYQVLFTGTGNPILHQLIGMLQRRVTQLRALTLAQPGRPEASAAEIRDILTAIQADDPLAARLAAALHVEHAFNTVLETLRRAPELAADCPVLRERRYQSPARISAMIFSATRQDSRAAGTPT
jgi:DNA-binding GntR family transcriptional regulator